MHEIQQRISTASPAQYSDLFWPRTITKDIQGPDEMQKKQLLFPREIKTTFKYICEHAKRNQLLKVMNSKKQTNIDEQLEVLEELIDPQKNKQKSYDTLNKGENSIQSQFSQTTYQNIPQNCWLTSSQPRRQLPYSKQLKNSDFLPQFQTILTSAQSFGKYKAFDKFASRQLSQQTKRPDELKYKIFSQLQSPLRSKMVKGILDDKEIILPQVQFRDQLAIAKKRLGMRIKFEKETQEKFKILRTHKNRFLAQYEQREEKKKKIALIKRKTESNFQTIQQLIVTNRNQTIPYDPVVNQLHSLKSLPRNYEHNNVRKHMARTQSSWSLQNMSERNNQDFSSQLIIKKKVNSKL